MIGWKCSTCDFAFVEPVHHGKYISVDSGRCPECGSDDYEEAELCDNCHELMPVAHAVPWKGETIQVCDKCVNEDWK